LHSRKERSGCMERIVTAMQDGGAGAGARHKAAARVREATSFCLAAGPLYGPPGRGDFLVSDFHPGLIPGNLASTISGSEDILAGKWGGLFLGYLLRKNLSAVAVRHHLSSWRWQHDTTYNRGRARSNKSGARPV
jgi:hypothetical protein